MTGFICLNMKLIRLENYKIIADDELLLLKPFRELYKSDKTKDKGRFFDFLTVLYFTYDPRSDYSYISSEEDRLREVYVSNGIDSFRFSKLHLECIEMYKKSTTTSASLLLEDTKITIEKIREMLKTINFEDLEEKDKVTAIKNVASTVAMIPKLVKDLSEAEKSVVKEIEEKGRARGGNIKKIFEDGF